MFVSVALFSPYTCVCSLHILAHLSILCVCLTRGEIKSQRNSISALISKQTMEIARIQGEHKAEESKLRVEQGTLNNTIGTLTQQTEQAASLLATKVGSCVSEPAFVFFLTGSLFCAYVFICHVISVCVVLLCCSLSMCST